MRIKQQALTASVSQRRIYRTGDERAQEILEAALELFAGICYHRASDCRSRDPAADTSVLSHQGHVVRSGQRAAPARPLERALAAHADRSISPAAGTIEFLASVIRDQTAGYLLAAERVMTELVRRQPGSKRTPRRGNAGEAVK
jgi:hypothetical protein